MHRSLLRSQIQLYQKHFSRFISDSLSEPVDIGSQFLKFVDAEPTCFERTCAPGHITGSAFVLAPDYESVLLLHHRKLGRWLQPGGHADGETLVHLVALRETEEESGLTGFAFFKSENPLLPDIFDLDIHPIPAAGAVPEHLHYDVRFLLVASTTEPPPGNNESNAVRWFSWDELSGLDLDRSISRMIIKSRKVIAEGLG